MNDSFFYTVGMPGIKIERDTFYTHFFFIKHGNESFKKIPENFYRGFWGIILFFPSGRGRTEVFYLVVFFYYFHLIIHFQNYRDADITYNAVESLNTNQLVSVSS